jgi:uncharacterized lipoprotein YehR (DUF1307 family)
MKQLGIRIIVIVVCVTLYACPKREEGHRFINFVNKADRNIL